MDYLTPELLEVSNAGISESLSARLKDEGYEYRDLFHDQSEELIDVRAIGKEKGYYSASLETYRKEASSNVVLYPWRKLALRVLVKDDFQELLTSRNRNLITAEEQDAYRNCILAVGGLSVGSNIISTIAMQGGCTTMRIADFDLLSTSNLNRVAGALPGVGKPKTEGVAQRVWEINPYVKIAAYSEGITKENITEFVRGATVVFDEIDSLDIKLNLRLEAKRHGIPLAMITDNGDNVMVDIERYDIEPSLAPFHGLISDEDIEIIRNSFGDLTPMDRVKISLKIIQPQNAVPRMQNSLMEVGKTIKTWPQISTASTLAGATGTYIVRHIALGAPLKTGRLHVSLDAALTPDYDSNDAVQERQRRTEEFVRMLQSM